MALIGAGCSSGSTAGQAPLASHDEIVAYSHVMDLIPAQVDVDGVSGFLVVDTGAPIGAVDRANFPGAPSVGAVGTVQSLSVGPVHATNLSVFGTDAFSSDDPAMTVGGLLGAGVFVDRRVTFNYRDAKFTIGGEPTPSGTGTPTTVPFSLEGGGTESNLPRTRIVVNVDIEGRSHLMIVDTGASMVTVDGDVFASLTTGGRPSAPAGMLHTTTGDAEATMLRTRSISLGPVASTGVVVTHDTDFDSHLDQVSAEIGHKVEGSLGGSFLHDYFVTVDYPNQQLHFARYDDLGWVVDAGERLGFQITRPAAGRCEVVNVIPGTDAARQGVAVGDVVVAIDGAPLASLTLSELAAKVCGPVGTLRNVQFGAAKNHANQTVAIRVDELLPI
jgi:hypothetical protein